MAKYVVTRAFHGAAKGDTFETDNLHPALLANVAPAEEGGKDLGAAETEAATLKLPAAVKR